MKERRFRDGKAIPYYPIAIRRETPGDELIGEEKHDDQASLSFTIPADGSVRAFVKVESPGYKYWENAPRMNLKEDKPLYIRGEMVKEAGVQG